MGEEAGGVTILNLVLDLLLLFSVWHLASSPAFWAVLGDIYSRTAGSVQLEYKSFLLELKNLDLCFACLWTERGPEGV